MYAAGEIPRDGEQTYILAVCDGEAAFRFHDWIYMGICSHLQQLPGVAVMPAIRPVLQAMES
jgi:hypothetical protein